MRKPNFMEAERFVLGMLLTGKHPEDTLGMLTSANFRYSLNAEVFDTACTLYREHIPITPETVTARMAQLHGNNAFNRSYVSWLAKQAPEEVFSEYCCFLVQCYSAQQEADSVDEGGYVYDEEFLPFD